MLIWRWWYQQRGAARFGVHLERLCEGVDLIALLLAGRRRMMLPMCLMVASSWEPHRSNLIPNHLTNTPEMWINRGQPNPHENITLTFALRQSNLKKLEKMFWEVSNPKHPQYGAYMDDEEITEIVRPHPKTTEAVASFLEHSGVPRYAHQISGNEAFLEVTVPVVRAEKMFQTTFNTFEHRSRGLSYVRAIKPYHAPQIENHIDFIGGLTHLPTIPETGVHQKASAVEERRRLEPAMGIKDAQGVSAAAGKSILMANPLAWRGSNVSLMLLLRCKDGSLPTATYDCPEAMGMRTLRISLVPDSKNLTTLDHHYALDGNKYWPDLKTGKWKTETDIAPFCKRCSEYNEIHNDVDTFKLCQDMQRSVGVHPSKDVMTCLFTYNAAQLQGEALAIDVELFFEHDAPAPSSFTTGCPPGKSPYLCEHAFTPQPKVSSKWLHDFYSIPAKSHGTGTLHGNAMAAVQFLGESFDASDLQKYLVQNNIPKQKVARIVGANNGKTGDTATVDVQVMMSLAPLVPMWVWSVPGRRPASGGNNEPFLRWLLDLANTKKPPLVLSVSYSDDEGLLPHSYSDRLNAEFMKAALRGITILFISGVDGAGGVAVRTKAKNATCGVFRPQFPSSSPYVTSVGATAVQKQPNGQIKEVVCDAHLGVGITSGGGFSGRYERPLYQAAAVKHYLSNYKQPPNFDVNSTRRAYPDISAIGPAFEVHASQRNPESFGGTAASAPTLAAMIALLNDVRLAGGLPPLGFVNPLLYSLSRTYAKGAVRPFKDITIGNNKCSSFSEHCCHHGFSAAPGWDATTGVGSPNFTVISDILGTYLGACLGMDCGGGTCQRGACVCNDGFHRNAAGRCIALPPFPLKQMLMTCGGVVALATIIILWKSCCGLDDKANRRGGGGGKQKGMLHRIRKAIFPYKFVIVSNKDKSGGGGGSRRAMSTRPTAQETAPIMQQQTYSSSMADEYGTGALEDGITDDPV